MGPMGERLNGVERWWRPAEQQIQQSKGIADQAHSNGKRICHGVFAHEESLGSLGQGYVSVSVHVVHVTTAPEEYDFDLIPPLVRETANAASLIRMGPHGILYPTAL